MNAAADPESAISSGSAHGSPLLETHGLCKRFPGVQALDNVSFAARRGEVHALMGENGAGKSTLIKILAGVYRPDSGALTLDGAEINPRSPMHAQRLGVTAVYQEINLIPQLSIAENLALGRQPMKRGRIDWRAAHINAIESLRTLDLDVDVRRPLSSYSIAVQQMIAIARALGGPAAGATAPEAKLLILDEPTSSLDQGEVAQLFRVVRSLKDRGLGIIFITHFLDQVYEIADRVTVLRNGRVVGVWKTSELSRLELVASMIGRPIDEAAKLTSGTRATTEPAPRRHEREETLLLAQGIGRRGGLDPVDLELRAGETVGLAGLLGSGRTELARLLFGADRADCGSIIMNGRRRRRPWRSPREAIASGLGFCPEDRKSEGLIPDLSARENIVLALQARRGWRRPIRAASQRRLADHFVKALRIATPDIDKPAGQLSGGNQQKLILARWLASEPRILIVDEPTRGIDVGAKAEIERLIGDLCRDGMAILFISSELDEVARDSHRVVVLRDRRKVAELSEDEISVPAIMRIIATEATVEPGAIVGERA